MKRGRKTVRRQSPLTWLPIDSRLLPPLFSFGRVHGLARLFLTVEMMLAVLVVIGVMVLLVLELLKG